MTTGCSLEDLAKSCETLAAGTADEVTRWKLLEMAAEYRHRSEKEALTRTRHEQPDREVFDEEFPAQVGSKKPMPR